MAVLLSTPIVGGDLVVDRHDDSVLDSRVSVDRHHPHG
jgi:hypothetical protein